MAVISGARYRVGAEGGDLTSYGPVISAGTPGTAFGVGTLEKGALVINTQTGKLHINTGSISAPTWTVVGAQS